MDLADEIADDYLTCSICLDPYREPKQLPCLHSFCRKCLGDHIANNVPQGRTLSFTCPVCRKATIPANPDARRLREWADSFPDNFFILGLMETLHTRSSNSVLKTTIKLSKISENCVKHPENKCDSYCTLKRIGVCNQCCKTEHKECGSHHLNTEDATKVTERKLQTFKIKMENLRDDVETARERLEISKPRELRLQREEIALKVSEHFSDLKSKFIKCLIQKEKEVAEQLADIIDDEKKGLSDSVDECSSLIKSFKGTVNLFDKLMTSCPVNALTALYNMEEQMASYTTAVKTLQAASGKSPIEFVPSVTGLEEMLAGVKIGEIHLGKKKTSLKLVEGGEEDAEEEEPSEEEEEDEEDEQEEQEEDHEEVSQIVPEQESTLSQAAAHQIQPSAPPVSPQEEMPYCLQGFSSISLGPCTGQYGTNTTQSSPAGTPSSPTLLSSGSRSRSLQPRAAENYPISLWRTVAFFGNVTYSERRGGLGGITAITRNILAVADRFNKSIKIMSIKGKIVNTLTFANMDPWDITYDRSSRELVVTCPNQSCIVFVTEDTDYLSFYINHTVYSKQYASIACLKNHTYVVGICRTHGNPRVEIINNHANVLSYVDSQVEYPRGLESLNDGKLVICDWTKKEVSMVGPTGFVDDPYHGVVGTELKEPMGITKDAGGNVYVLDHKTKKVHVISGITGGCRTILNLEGVSDPRMICMVDSSRTGQALVVLDSQNGVHVYTVDVPAGNTQV